MSGVPSATAASSVMLMTVSSSRVVVIVAMASHPRRHYGRRLGSVAGSRPGRRRRGGRALPDHDPLPGLEARDDLRRDPAHDAHAHVAVLDRPVTLHYPHHGDAVRQARAWIHGRGIGATIAAA